MRKIAYDWTGQRARRRRFFRVATITTLMILAIGIPFFLLR